MKISEAILTMFMASGKLVSLYGIKQRFHNLQASTGRKKPWIDTGSRRCHYYQATYASGGASAVAAYVTYFQRNPHWVDIQAGCCCGSHFSIVVPVIQKAEIQSSSHERPLASSLQSTQWFCYLLDVVLPVNSHQSKKWRRSSGTMLLQIQEEAIPRTNPRFRFHYKITSTYYIKERSRSRNRASTSVLEARATCKYLEQQGSDNGRANGKEGIH